MDKIEKLRTYTENEIENMNNTELRNKFKELQEIAEKGNKVILALDKMKKRYKLALFIVIRNSKVMPIGRKLGKSQKEINKMSYETLCEVITMIDFNRAEKEYEQGKNG